MFYKLICLCWLATCAYAAPSPDGGAPPEKQQPTVIPIVSQSEELEPNGTYKFSYETGNGIKREEISYDKVLPKAEGRSADSSNEGGESDDSEEIHVQQGSYSYTAPDGTLISVRYIADENGFQPFGDHLPRVPVAVPDSVSSGEKTGRALKHADSAQSETAPAVVAKSAKPSPPPTEAESTEKETVPQSAEAKSATEASAAPSSVAKPSEPSTVAVQEASSTENASEATTDKNELTQVADTKTEASITEAPSENPSTEAGAAKTSVTESSTTDSSITTGSETSTSAPEVSTTAASEEPASVASNESASEATTTSSEVASTPASDSRSTTASDAASEKTTMAAESAPSSDTSTTEVTNPTPAAV